ncbi:V/A-type H+-transporting ATPase subunit I [Halogranum gelatinilyticum]|uniref:A-type ATP synthase subunit I n=1 Tax=Halogranum gelatinilyticum TaxID=660521 RepID=A0A1G9PM91_9EURY|nr:V-type ATP synthase subunit I [Halogranum gelatinilyticum]SDL99205.1 V/A-type H+-transporting ATPase subunit I [Halogranum gelatinilyticum]
MLRPEQMSKVSVTGSKRFMDDVIETVHDLNLLHVTEYDGSWESFGQGDPLDGAEGASDKLVTVRSLESILDVDAEDAGPTRIVDDDELEAELEEVRARVNELDDRRDELRTEIRDIDEQIGAMAPFAKLGIDLDLLSGYDSIQVAVGQGKPDTVEDALAHANELQVYDVFSEGNVVAAFARPEDSTNDSALTDALVGADFAALSVPEADASPEAYVEELEQQKRELRSELNTVEDELESVKLEAAGFLLAAEEKLSIDVQKTEAPLSFATTENAFVAEGWIPTTKFGDFVSGLNSAVGNHVEVEELERASFDSSGHESVREPVGDQGSGVAADGGQDVVMQKDDPPVVQDNPGAVKPFEILVNAVSKPNYREFDPSVFVFLTFPVFFGLMIGDLGYGMLYSAIGYFLYTNFEDRPAFKSMGGITLFAGVFTMLFGILYGEIFGLHLIATYFWEGVVGLSHAPIEKGLSPAGISWAITWLVVSVFIGILHLNIGWILDFIETTELHDVKHAIYESGSWLIMMNSLWYWIFSQHYGDSKPAFLFTLFDGTGAAPESQQQYFEAVFNLGFNGFPAMELFTIPGLGISLSVPLVVFFIGLALLIVGEPAEAVEFLNVLVNVLSYARIGAVLLAKAGMALAVNLLVFGAYQHDGEIHFMLEHGPQWVINEYGAEAIMFEGLFNGGAALFLVGILVLLLGHALVLILGVTSAGLQAVRLEYVEFFGKFYEGGGSDYEPFGYDRQYTTKD